MILNDSKNQRQLKDALTALNTKVGTIVQKQGFGKTRTGCLIIQGLYKFCPIIEPLDLIVIVHSQIVKKQWLKTLDSLNIKATVVTIGEYQNNKEDENGYVYQNSILTIFDEIHLYNSLERRLIIENCNSTYKIGLTATYPKYSEFATYLNNVLPIISEIPEHEYVENNWNVKLKELCILVELNPEERNGYEEFTAYIKETLQIFDNDYNQIDKAIKGDKYVDDNGNIQFIEPYDYLQRFAAKNNWNKDLDLSIDYYAQLDSIYNPVNLFERVKLYYEVVRKRLNIVYNCKEKIRATIEVLELLTSYTTIIFSESTEMCNTINKAINKHFNENYCAAYHSKLETYIVTDEKGKEVKFGKTRQLNLILEKLAIGELRAVSTVKSFNTGVDIPILKASIILSGTRNYTTNEQRNSRVTRLIDDCDTAYSINIVAKNTVDYTAYKQRNKNKQIYNISLNDFIEKFAKT